ncbi:hypothetical protein HaLaN_19316 [Haematococcus lacustris]|uniref:Uncharacterized protein n=1 Tax=Haematococcus lacustris TaxID=44745 RepID=A0A699ZGS2_HAELA|nr:hypothetical protein HaLaN_19316 [Haematococcus lacustris]
MGCRITEFLTHAAAHSVGLVHVRHVKASRVLSFLTGRIVGRDRPDPSNIYVDGTIPNSGGPKLVYICQQGKVLRFAVRTVQLPASATPLVSHYYATGSSGLFFGCGPASMTS